MLVKSIKRHRYAGQMHEVGDEYELTGQHVKLLEAVGRIRRIQPAPAPIPAPSKEVAKPKAVKKKATKNKATKKKDKGNYKNKRMVSE